MRATLSFKLPEERDDFEDAMNAQNFVDKLDEIDEHCRQKMKYTELTEVEAKIYREIRTMIADQP